VNREKYTVQSTGRGEEIVYADHDLALSLTRTYCDGHRLFCIDTATAPGGGPLPFRKRQEVIENLCEYFNTVARPSIFVIDEADRDREKLAKLFSNLVSKGHQISVEYDSAEKREQARDEMFIGILKAGKALSIHGRDITSIEDYWRWKNNG
jgi:hypothetical protein